MFILKDKYLVYMSPELLVTADGLCAPSQKMNSSCLVTIVNQYLTVVASEWKQNNNQLVGALVLLTLTCLKWFCFCNTNGCPRLSSGKESDKDGLLLERSLFQMYIKIHAFDHVKHLTSLVSCRESEASQEGAEVPEPSVVTHGVVGAAVCSSACRLRFLQVHSSAVVTYRGGRRVS